MLLRVLYKVVYILVLSAMLFAAAACSSVIQTDLVDTATVGEPAEVESSTAPISTDGATSGDPNPGTTTPEPVRETQPNDVAQDVDDDLIDAVEIPGDTLWGIEMHSVSTAGGLDLVKGAGADWVRRNALLWSHVEPQEGERKWDALAGLEDEMISASKEGVELILIVRRTPVWAQKNLGVYCGQIKDEKVDEFASFMYDVVERYSAPPYNVKYWEIGNEPDIDPAIVEADSIYGCLGDSSADLFGGDYYASVLKLAYPHVKAANPDAQLLVGGLLLDCDPIDPPETSEGSGEYKDCTSSRYLEGILDAGGGDYFDGVSFHAYDYYYGGLGKYGNLNWHSEWNSTGPVLSQKTEYIRSILNQFGYFDKYLINSEVAIICGSTGEEPYCQTDEFELTKAYYAAQAYASALAEGLKANIWYSTVGWRGSGMFTGGNTPLLVFDAYQFSAQELSFSEYVGQVSPAPGVTGYEFIRDDTHIWILWSVDGESHLVQLTFDTMAVYDVFGAPLPDVQELQVNLEPVYIEFVP